MKFIIASLTRSGEYRGTSRNQFLFSGFNQIRASFLEPGIDQSKVRKRTLNILSRFDGIKHVWDPNGWPFRNPKHISTPAALRDSEELVAPNRAMLECADRVLFLRRRNLFDRTMSDLWGQQTDHWGHNPYEPYDPAEVEKYRTAIRDHVPAPIDAEVFSWYMRNVSNWEDRIIAGIPSGKSRTFFYEDLFGNSDLSEGRAAAWMELGKWLRVEIDLTRPDVNKIISPDSKLNSYEIYENIPNFKELRMEFADVAATGMSAGSARSHHQGA